MKLMLIGGAAGVGKTSLIQPLVSKNLQINTGTIFKKYMSLEKRDDVRKGDWSIYEQQVVTELSDFILESFDKQKNVIIDTHFAAKIYDRNYRIGLKENYISDIGTNIFVKKHLALSIHIILVTLDPYSLLNRRRLDTSRDRVLVPSDCYNDLRSNDMCSLKYKSEFLRAAQKIGDFGQDVVRYHQVENKHLDLAQSELKKITGE
jgi:adenylate kinase